MFGGGDESGETKGVKRRFNRTMLAQDWDSLGGNPSIMKRGKARAKKG